MAEEEFVEMTRGAQPQDDQVRVRRARVDSVEVFEVKDTELELLEKGTPADIYLNFSLFLYGSALTGLIALVTSTFKSASWEMFAQVVVVVGVVVGTVLLLLWRQSRKGLRGVIRTIRDRMQPERTDTTQPDHPGMAGVHPGPVPEADSQSPRGGS